MLTLALWALRIKTVLSKLLEWAIANWQLVLFAVLVLAVYYYQNKAEAIQLEFDRHLAVDVAAAEKRRVENQIKTEHFNKALQESEAQHLAQMASLQLDRQREAKALKELYEKDKTGFKFRLDAYADRMLLERERAAAAGLPPPEGDSLGLTQAESDCYAAYTSLENACRITTIDYNRLRAWADATCDLVTCK